MRRPADIKPWLSLEDLASWVQSAPSVPEHTRRLAIWLTHTGPFFAHQVARLLDVSIPAVWKWVGDYNRSGPEGLTGLGRGGRRWAFLSWDQEEALLGRWLERAARGEVVTAPHVWDEVCATTGRRVSLDYVYRLLHRHEWGKRSPRPRHVKARLADGEAFKKTSRTSSRKRSGKRRSTGR
jgi:transposase